MSRLVITGPTGWVGSAALAWAGARGMDVLAFGSSGRMYNNIKINALSDIAQFDLSDAIVLHLAFLTKDKTANMADADYRAANAAIDHHVLKACQRTPPRGLFVASSGAAAHPVEAYGQMKIEQEQRFLDWGQGAGVPVLAGRIYNIAGPHINKHALYALSSLIVQARDTGLMAIQADRPVFRAYTHVDDVITVIMAALLAGEGRAAAFDIAGNELVEMDDVARAVSRHLPVPITRPTVDWSRPSVYAGAAADFRALALKYGIVPRCFATQVADTVDYLRVVDAVPASC